MSLEERYGQSLLKNRKAQFVLGLIMVAIFFGPQAVDWVQAQGQGKKEKAVYRSEQGRYVVTYWNDQRIPFMDGWKKESVKGSPSTFRDQFGAFHLSITDDVGKIKNLPCENVIVESLDKPRILSKAKYYLRNAREPDLSVPIRGVTEETYRFSFEDGYGNEGYWYCPDEVERIPVR